MGGRAERIRSPLKIDRRGGVAVPPVGLLFAGARINPARAARIRARGQCSYTQLHTRVCTSIRCIPSPRARGIRTLDKSARLIRPRMVYGAPIRVCAALRHLFIYPRHARVEMRMLLARDLMDPLERAPHANHTRNRSGNIRRRGLSLLSWTGLPGADHSSSREEKNH